MQKTVARILLVDDHAMFREAVRDMLEREDWIEVVGEAGTAEAAIRLVADANPDLVLLDVSLPGRAGPEIARTLCHQSPGIKILACSMHIEGHIIEDILKSGASGYVTKTSSKSELLKGIRRVLAGRTFLCDEASSIMASRVRRDNDAGLSNRELRVLGLLAEGKRGPEIAEILSISPSTVEVHRRNIMRKLDIHSSIELTRYALREGISRL